MTVNGKTGCVASKSRAVIRHSLAASCSFCSSNTTPNKCLKENTTYLRTPKRACKPNLQIAILHAPLATSTKNEWKMLPVIHSDLLLIGLLWGKTSCQTDKLNFQGQTDRQRTKTYIAACLSLRYPKRFIDGSIVFRLLIKMFRAPRQNVGFVKIWKKYIEESSLRSSFSLSQVGRKRRLRLSIPK